MSKIVRVGTSPYWPQSWGGKALLFDASVVGYAGVVPDNVSGAKTPGIDPLAYAYVQFGPGWQRMATDRYTTTMLPTQIAMEKAANLPTNAEEAIQNSAKGVASIPPAGGTSPVFTQGAILPESFNAPPNNPVNQPPMVIAPTIPAMTAAATAGDGGASAMAMTAANEAKYKRWALWALLAIVAAYTLTRK
jgi:hypothetical protein